MKKNNTKLGLLGLILIVFAAVSCNKKELRLQDMEVEEISISETKYYEDNPDYASYKVGINIQLPVSSQGDIFLRLKDSIIAQTFYLEYDSKESSLDEGVKQYIDEKTEIMYEPDSEFLRDNRASNHFWTNLEGSFVYQKDWLASYRVGEDNYLGGAHPFRYTYHFNYDIDSGEVIRIEDILNKDFLEGGELRDMLISQLLIQEEAESLEEIGIFDFMLGDKLPDFPISNNVYFIDDTLVFFYGQYEIRAYVYGETRIKIPLKDLEENLKPRFQTIISK